MNESYPPALGGILLTVFMASLEIFVYEFPGNILWGVCIKESGKNELTLHDTNKRKHLQITC